MRPSHILTVFFSVIVISGASMFYYEYQMPDIESLDRDVSQRLLKIDELNSNVSELALRSRVNIDKNYDALAQTTTLLEQKIQELQSNYFNDPAIKDSLLEKHFLAFKNMIESKKDLIENFKSHNSVLRNSEKYAPIVGHELVLVAEENNLPEIANVYREITFKVLEHSRQDDILTKPLLDSFLASIAESESKMPSDKLVRIIEFSNHVSTMVKEKEETDIYLKKALTSSLNDKSKELLSAWGDWVDEQNKSRESFSLFVQVYIVILILSIIFVALKLRALYISLDKKVADRTAEVEAAYEELSQSEKLLMQSEKMMSLGQLVAGVAHEVNTPLGYITSNVETIEANLNELAAFIESSEPISEIVSNKPVDNKKLGELIMNHVKDYRKIKKENTIPEIKELSQDVLYGLKQISKLVLSLKEFSHPDKGEVDQVDVNKELDSTENICSSIMGNRKLIKQYAEDLPLILGRRTQLAQVFMNIIINAAQATDEKNGTVEIITAATDRGVNIVFKDNGHGMEQSACDRIFDPFFTTKGVNEGMGLGMSISYKIIESHGGDISVQSKVNEGTVITVSLPFDMAKQ